MEFARQLEKAAAGGSLRLDVYGSCGSLGPVPGDEVGLWARYKFYLAFENSGCRDYITEKFFKVLEHDVIPVARGAPLE